MIETVTISTAEYERLISAAEDLADLQVVAAYKADLKDGFSSEFVKRMLEGESLWKLWREHRGLSQSALSKLSGVNRIQIGDIESRGRTGSITTLKKLANALEIQVDDLIWSLFGLGCSARHNFRRDSLSVAEML